MSATANRAPAVVLGATLADANDWAERLKAGEPTEGPFRPFPTNGASHRGARVRRIYVTPAAHTGRGYHLTLADLRRSMAKTRGGDTTGPVFLREGA